MAQASKAIIPKDPGGPFGTRIGVNVAGGKASTLVVGAYVTRRNNAADWLRYSIVVLNSNDGSAQGGWNPQPVKTAINFRGMQAIYTFPVGVTTLWWYAPSTSASKRFAPTANNMPSFNYTSTNTNLTSEIRDPGTTAVPYPQVREAETRANVKDKEALMHHTNQTIRSQNSTTRSSNMTVNTGPNMTSNMTVRSTSSDTNGQGSNENLTSLEGTLNVTSL
ncbi:hypothetical protein VKT23_016522 [Stygiomarasmius scandens]|uniref:Uncharacterized protein n=1 Tax=Marasmiellus scandens TaxID=2682957 RepID=A0ABR1IUP6_9AGAR